jgi:hypothetical protein
MKTIIVCLMAAIGFVVGLGKAKAECAVSEFGSAGFFADADPQGAIRANAATEAIRKM